MENRTYEGLPHFRIEGKLPSLNEYLEACGENPKRGIAMKNESKKIVVGQIRSYLPHLRVSKPIVIHYVFYEPWPSGNAKLRDYDNIFSYASKVVQDAMKQTKIIQDDGPKYIRNFSHAFHYSKTDPHIDVYIQELR